MGIFSKKKKEEVKSEESCKSNNRFNLFSNKKSNKTINLCNICEKNEGKLIVADGFVCKDCFILAYDQKPLFKKHKDKKLSSVKASIENNNIIRENIKNFTTTAYINGVRFDDNKKQIMLSPRMGYTLSRIYDYSKILNFELIEDGNTLVSKGGLGRAIAGGVLFGGVGAIVGGVTGKRTSNETLEKLIVRLTIDNPFRPIHEDIVFISSKTNKNSKVYSRELQNAKDLLLKLENARSSCEDETINNTNPINITNNNISVADELIKLKSLMDEGLITKSEFEDQKNKLLNK